MHTRNLWTYFLHKLSIKGKLLALIMFVSISSIIATSAIFILYEIYETGKENEHIAKIIVQIMAEKIAPALLFEHPDLTKAELQTFSELPSVNRAYVLDKKGNFVAAYRQEIAKTFIFPRWWFIGAFVLKQAINSASGQIGTLIVEYDNRELSDQLWIVLFVSLGILAIGIIVAYEVMRKSHRVFTGPLGDLVDFSKKLGLGQYDLRIHLPDQAEFTMMAQSINSMLDNIEMNEKALKREVERAEREAILKHELLEKTRDAKEALERQNIIRSEAEWELQKVQSHLNDIINSMPSVLVGVDRTKRITEWNEAAAEFFEVGIVQALGKNLIKMLPQLKSYLDILEKALQTREIQKSGRFFFPDHGKERYLDILVYPLSSDGGDGAVIRIDDVTTRVKMDDILQQSQKMMSVSGLAAGMAHEINNPLGGIIQSAQNIERRIEPGLPANEEIAKTLGVDLKIVHAYFDKRGILKFIKGIRELGERAAGIVHNMLQFSRPIDHKMTKVSLSELIDRTIALAASDYDLKKNLDFAKIIFEKEYPTVYPEVFCLPEELEQAILNIFRNAAQVMMTGTPRTENPTVHIKLSFTTQDATIEIKDNGPGMTEEVKTKCLEPFFTTHETGQGTGLGLSVAFFIVSVKHNGAFRVESTVGHGANFIITIPLGTNGAEESKKSSVNP